MSSSAESVFFPSSGLRMHAVRVPGCADGRSGAEAGRPVVVVPGITTPAAAFLFAAERWARFAGDLYVLDMRGRGLSERAGHGRHRAADYAEDVLALIAHLGVEHRRPLLVGHSLGARVVASARALVPGCSAGVVAIDPPMSGPSRRPYPMGVDRFVSGIQGARAGRGTIEAREHYPTWTDEQVRARGESLGSCDELAVIESYSWFHLEAFPPMWAQVEPPALLLFGEESPVVRPEDVAEIERVNPRSSITSVAQAGHMVPWDNPEQTAEEIEAFMSQLEGRSQ